MDDKLALFTESTDILARFMKWTQLMSIIPYLQVYPKGNPTIKAYDLYFPKSAKKQLIRALNNNRPTVPKKEGSLR